MKLLGLTGILMVAASATSGAQQTPPAQTQEEIPAAYMPPKGMCRIWLKDVPPAQQPAPTDCAAAVKNCPKNGRVIFGATEEAKKPKIDPKTLPPGTKSLTGT